MREIKGIKKRINSEWDLRMKNEMMNSSHLLLLAREERHYNVSVFWSLSFIVRLHFKIYAPPLFTRLFYIRISFTNIFFLNYSFLFFFLSFFIQFFYVGIILSLVAEKFFDDISIHCSVISKFLLITDSFILFNLISFYFIIISFSSCSFYFYLNSISIQGWICLKYS